MFNKIDSVSFLLPLLSLWFQEVLQESVEKRACWEGLCLVPCSKVDLFAFDVGVYCRSLMVVEFCEYLYVLPLDALLP